MTIPTTGLRRRLWRRPSRAPGTEATRGQALVEFAFGLPLMLLIMVGTLDIGQMFIDYVALRNGCREGASYAARNPGESIDDGGPIRERIEAHSSVLESGFLSVTAEYSTSDFDPEATNRATVTITCEREYAPIMAGFLATFDEDLASFRLSAATTAEILK